MRPKTTFENQNGDPESDHACCTSLRAAYELDSSTRRFCRHEDEPHFFEWTSAVTDDFYSRLPECDQFAEGTELRCVRLLESRQSVWQSVQ